MSFTYIIIIIIIISGNNTADNIIWRTIGGHFVAADLILSMSLTVFVTSAIYNVSNKRIFSRLFIRSNCIILFAPIYCFWWLCILFGRQVEIINSLLLLATLDPSCFQICLFFALTY